MTIDDDAPISGALHASGIASLDGMPPRDQHGPWLWELLPDETTAGAAPDAGRAQPRHPLTADRCRILTVLRSSDTRAT